jgi:D-alanyl-D-alanine dipeptidase
LQEASSGLLNIFYKLTEQSKNTTMKSIYCLFLLLPFTVLAQQQPKFDLPISKYGLPVVNDVEIYKKIVRANPDNELLDLRKLIPDAKFDVRYATADNLIKRPLYPSADVFLRKPAALAIKKAHENLKKQGYGLVFFDGYRPYEVTVLFYEVVKDTTFVADPHKGSKHNRGMAMDLSMYDLKTGQLVHMPSEYDETTSRAFHSYMDTDSLALANRKILRTAMEAVGFDIYPWEWWHYDFKGWQTCFTYDIWHAKIREANKQLHAKKKK